MHSTGPRSWRPAAPIPAPAPDEVQLYEVGQVPGTRTSSIAYERLSTPSGAHDEVQPRVHPSRSTSS
jgi:hypothetical protein